MYNSFAALQSVRTSHNIYGSSTISAFEMEIGLTRPLCGSPKPLPDDICDAPCEWDAKRKLT